MTNRNAQFRPHCVDLSPGNFASVGTSRAESRSRAARLYAKAAERNALKISQGRTSSYSGAVHSGAVRVSSAHQTPSFQHTGKVTLALLLIGSGIFWTTSSNGTDKVVPVVVKASIATPTFFFDDSADALSAQAETSTSRNQATIAELVAPADPDGNASIAQPASIVAVLDSLAQPEEQLAVLAAPTLVESGQHATSEHPSLVALRKNALSPEGAQTTAVSVASGDTLSGILNKHGVKIDQMPQLLTDDIVKEHLSRLNIGQKLEISQLQNGDFHSLSARVGEDKRITIRRSANDFAIASIDLPVEKERVVTSGTIEQSLFLAAEQANLKQSTIMELAEIFQWELDFARDIRKGDQFSLVYDRLYRDGGYIGDGDILAAEFVRGGKSYRAIRFTTDDGVTGYYSPDGKSKRRTFKRHPVDVVRITSKFSPNRLHPVLHQIRAHRGVDYGSPYGSPIYATADGKVTFSGNKNAYGKTVVLQHGRKFSTLYAHMSKISGKSSVDQRVKQGDVIGYVGNSGRVTGTHLHYEFRVNGTQIDPLKVELPAAQPIDKKYMEELKAMSDDMTAQMRSVLSSDQDNQVAAMDQITDAGELPAVTPEY